MYDNLFRNSDKDTKFEMGVKLALQTSPILVRDEHVLTQSSRRFAAGFWSHLSSTVLILLFDSFAPGALF